MFAVSHQQLRFDGDDSSSLKAGPAASVSGNSKLSPDCIVHNTKES